MRAPRSLRTRIVLAAVAALAICGVLAGAVLLAAVEHDGRNTVDKDLRQRAQGILHRGPGPGPGRPFGGRPEPPPDERLLAGSDTFVQVAVGGRVIEQRGDVPANAPDVPNRDGLTTVQIGGDPWRSLTASVDSPPGARIQLLSSLAPVESRVDRIRRLVVLVGLAALAATALAAWGFTTLAVRPLARLRAGAARVSGATDLAHRLPEDEGPDEVRALAHTLNEMLVRLGASAEAMQRALEATRRFAADAGHELRTPLTSLRANVDTLERNPGLAPEQRQALVREISAEQERIVHLLEGLQALARGEAAESLPRDRIELGDVVDAALYSARHRHPSARFELEEQTDATSIQGWAGGLRLLVDNLLDNAALHGRPSGLVRVRLEPADGMLVVRVDDDGPGIPAAERERVLEPFTRGNGAVAAGTGLGLAIVAQQVALHDGAMTLGESQLGGLAVEIRLPLAAAEGVASVRS
jgi:two-component system, OmpR family, sensor histidine kinase PrrB